MADALERFFDWQSDMDWWWGPLLYLRPPKNVRLTLGFWLKLFGITILFSAPIGGALGALLAYYDSAVARHHDTKIPPVVAVEHWINGTAPTTVLSYGAFAIAIGFAGCFCQHWAWNRRADRLNREAALPPPAAVAVPGVWPPPPVVSAVNLPGL